MKKLVSLLTTLAMAASMMFTVAHADVSDYSSIGFGTSQYGDIKSYYAKGETKQLDIWALDEDGEDVDFSDDVVYSSSNENVVTVTAGGLMTAVDYGVATVTATCETLTASMLVTVTPNAFYQTKADKENSDAHARTGSKSVSVTVGTLSHPKNSSDGSTNTDHYAAATNSYHWPWPVPAKSNMVVEGWFYDSGETVNAEAAIGFKKNEVQSDTGVLGVLVSTDTNYKLSGVNARWDQVWDNHVSGTAAKDTGISRVKGWHQVTIVESYPGAAGNVTAKAGSDTVGKSLKCELYLDGQLVETWTSEHYTRWQMYGYAGFTEGSTAWFDDGVNMEYMQVNGVTLTTDPEDSDTLVANVDYVGNSGTNAGKTYQWYYAASADATSWTPIAGATSASYKPQDLPSGSFIKAGAVVTDTIKDVSYTTNEYFSAPTFVFDGVYNSISLGKSNSYIAKGGTIDLTVTGYGGDGIERTISERSGMTFTSSNEKVATVAADGTVTAVDYGVSTITLSYNDLTASMLVTVTPNAFYQTKAEKEDSTTRARTGSKSVSVTVGTLSHPKNSDGSTNTDHYAAATNSYHWPWPVPAKSNMVVEGWFYDSGETVNAEAAIGFKKNEIQSDTGVLGVLVSTDTTYKISGVNARWDQVWDNHVTGTNVTDTSIPRTKGWHQVTLVESYPGAAGNVTAKAGSDTVGKSLKYGLYLDGQLVRSGTSEHYTRWQMYGYAGFTEGSTAWFDDGVNLEYMQVNGVTLTTDPEDSETLVANVDYVGNSGTNAGKTYQWYYADSADATVWTPIAGATSGSYKPQDLPSGSYIKAGVVVTDTIGSTSYTTNEYFSDPTFAFDGVYNSISLGKSASYVAKGGTIDLTVTGYGGDGMERTIADRSEMTFASSDEQTATVSASGTVTAVDYGVSTITVTYGENSAKMLVTVTPGAINTMNPSKETATPLARTGGAAAILTVGTLGQEKDEKTSYPIDDKVVAAIDAFHWPANPTREISNMVTEGWFYDNGETANAESAIGFRRYNDYSNTGAIGVIRSADTTYKISGAGGRWDQIREQDVINSALTDTGIQRTKGWHQVTIVQGNTEGNVIEKATVGTDQVAKSNRVAIYLDGQLVRSGASKVTTRYQVYGYAGFTEGTTAYFDDGLNAYYVGISNVAITKDNGVLEAQYEYCGPRSNQTVSYQWYNNASGSWAAISGATAATYTPNESMNNTSFKVLVTVTDTVNGAAITTDRESFEYLDAETEISYEAGVVTVRAGEAINNGVLIIAGYEDVGGFKKLNLYEITDDFTASQGEVKNINTTITSGKIMLWESLKTQVPYCVACEIE